MRISLVCLKKGHTTSHHHYIPHLGLQYTLARMDRICKQNDAED
jgi:hypothetical protein